ncbi:hypothetical protein [Metabacillus sp. B2-18]|uniref:hypothetical protein n=1 Tax=Metabacillus sp. B2-18 TaxID=2897333 RepID=UPI001E4C8257|nr:hypothetical protein [Metabacillus sp. B2-18]UGB31688.1 hypothetical protein LPC09_04190 [Metabacillus sp. B2-18]
MNDLLKRIEQLEKENKVLQTMLESSQGNTKAWVKKYEEVAGKLETFKCGSCGVIHKTTRGKMTEKKQKEGFFVDEVQKFIANNQHQFGYIMQEASRQWIEKDPVGALTVGECNFVIQKYGSYHEILKNVQAVDTLNETRRKRDEVKGKLEVALKKASHWKKAFENENRIAGKLQKKVERYEMMYENTGAIFNRPNMKQQVEDLTKVIARNLVAWDTSKDKREGLLPEVYLTNKYWYKQLTGEEYFEHKAVKKFNID